MINQDSWLNNQLFWLILLASEESRLLSSGDVSRQSRLIEVDGMSNQSANANPAETLGQSKPKES